MSWQKDRPHHQGELEFHLTGLREMRGEHAARDMDEAEIRRRLEKRAHRHH